LEEVGNYGAHTPGHNQATKCWENVLAALKSHGIPFDNNCYSICSHLTGPSIYEDLEMLNIEPNILQEDVQDLG
jgi:hypothetical protein